MSISLIVNFPGNGPVFLPIGMPSIPSTEHFWAIIIWVVVPALLAVWIAYHRQKERLRRVHRQLRQLEARLAASTPAQAVLRASLPRPSSLTARIPISAPAPDRALPFAHAVTGPVA